MFSLLVSYHARQEQYVFTVAEAAQAEMAAIESKIGKKWYGKNGDEENPTYRFSHATGDAVICLEKVESASLIDLSKDEDVGAALVERTIALRVKYKVQERVALSNAGLLDTAQAAE